MFTLSGSSTINLVRTETNQMVVQRSKLSGQSISCLPSFSNLQASGCPLYNSDLSYIYIYDRALYIVRLRFEKYDETIIVGIRKYRLFKPLSNHCIILKKKK